MTTYPRSMNRYGDFSFYRPHQYKEGFHTSWKPSFVWRGLFYFHIPVGKQILKKMLRGISSDYMPRLVMETVGEMVHILLVSTFTVETAAFTEFLLQSLQGRRRQLYRHPAKCKLSSYYANFLVLNLKKTFWSAVKKGIFESGHPEFTMPCFAKVIMLAANRIQFSIFVKLVVPECWRNSTVRWRA